MLLLYKSSSIVLYILRAAFSIVFFFIVENSCKCFLNNCLQCVSVEESHVERVFTLRMQVNLNKHHRILTIISTCSACNILVNISDFYLTAWLSCSVSELPFFNACYLKLHTLPDCNYIFLLLSSATNEKT